MQHNALPLVLVLECVVHWAALDGGVGGTICTQLNLLEADSSSSSMINTPPL
jgi:hypothetical protein